MVADRARVRAAAALGRYLGTPAGRQGFSDNSYQSGTQIVLALETDPIRDVVARVVEHSPPVLVAVYLEGQDRFGFLDLAPGSAVEASSDDEIRGGGTVGMLFAMMEAQQAGQGLTFRVTDWDRFTVRSGFGSTKLMSA